MNDYAMIATLADAADDTYAQLREFTRTAALSDADASRLLGIASGLFHGVIVRADEHRQAAKETPAPMNATQHLDARGYSKGPGVLGW